jgi:hypothetical protein
MLADKGIIDEVTGQLNSNIVWIRYGDQLKYPYTNSSIDLIDHVHVEHETTKEGCITAYNLLTKQTEHLEFNEIYECSYELDPERAKLLFKRQEMELQTACKHCPDVDPKFITECRVNTALETYKESTWCALTLLDFRITDLTTIKDLQIDDDWREWYMNKIRKCREVSFVELDQLDEEAKKEGSSAEDLEDIDTIKQMFRDIPQDCDLTLYKTIVDLIEFWPSLLLPRPLLGASEANTHIAIDRINQVLKYPDGDPTPEESLRDLLQSIDNPEDLKQVIHELDAVKDTDVVVPEYAEGMILERVEELSNKT